MCRSHAYEWRFANVPKGGICAGKGELIEFVHVTARPVLVLISWGVSVSGLGERGRVNAALLILQWHIYQRQRWPGKVLAISHILSIRSMLQGAAGRTSCKR